MWIFRALTFVRLNDWLGGPSDFGSSWCVKPPVSASSHSGRQRAIMERSVCISIYI